MYNDYSLFVVVVVVLFAVVMIILRYGCFGYGLRLFELCEVVLG